MCTTPLSMSISRRPLPGSPLHTTHTGFGNTTAVSLGAAINATKNLMVGADVWMLQATKKVTNVAGTDTNKLGTEIDAKINWKMYENLSFNTTIGYFMPGDAYKVLDVLTGRPRMETLQLRSSLY